MVQRRRGHIVFISSLSGKAASPVSSMYSATKFGLRGFALGLREDLRRAGVGVSVVLPGFIRDAGMFADSGATLPPGVGTSSPEQVARAHAHCDRAQPRRGERRAVVMRLGANVAAVAPGVSAFGQRLAGGALLARRVSARQAGKRPDDRP